MRKIARFREILAFLTHPTVVPVPPWIQGSCYDIRRQELGAVWVARTPNVTMKTMSPEASTHSFILRAVPGSARSVQSRPRSPLVWADGGPQPPGDSCPGLDRLLLSVSSRLALRTRRSRYNTEACSSIAGAAGLNALLWSVTRVTPGDSAVK